MPTDISDRILRPNHIKAGLCTLMDGEFIYLTTKMGKRLRIFLSNADNEFIQKEADKYLSEIDYQE